ncbi:MAG: pyruvate carboxylase [Firmicutes bacterium]|nr:pyruvate carboxylase [Bacillota bacterium]
MSGKVNVKKFRKVLVANRGEIAIRIFRALSELGITTVSIYSKEDRYAMFRSKADESYPLNPQKGPIDAYLDIDTIIKIALSTGVDAIHPGYGFLSENPDFADACERNGIVFIGPGSNIMNAMGDKISSKKIAIEANVPIIPGVDYAIKEVDEAKKIAAQVGYPVMLKASNGGGGRGMRIVNREEDLEKEFNEAKNESKKAFGDDMIFIEKYLKGPKHIEVQIVGDNYGNVVHLYDRDCSVQRRHQKVVEYAPAFSIPETVRQEIFDASIRLAKTVGYRNAGTLEFLVDADNHPYFIEMNPRIQVEHTVSEMVTDIDIVQTQILIAEGYPLASEEIAIPSQESVTCTGYSIQTRVTTEDPANNFLPDTGEITVYRSGSGNGIRLDGGNAYTGAVISPYYDSLLVKITAFSRTFEDTRRKAIRALSEMVIKGVKTNIAFMLNVLNHPTFAAGMCDTGFIANTPDLLHIEKVEDNELKVIEFLGNKFVNETKGHKPQFNVPVFPKFKKEELKGLRGTKQLLDEQGPKAVADWVKDQKKLLITDTTMRDAQQSLMATRVRTVDMEKIAPAVSVYGKDLFSVEMWGGATFDTSYRFLKESPWERLDTLREKMPNILFQMLIRGANAVGYKNYPDNVIREFVKESAKSGIDVFRIFDSLNWLDGMSVALDETLNQNKIAEACLCYTGDILDESRTKYNLKYYVDMAKELEKRGAHMLGIKDMSGLLKPMAAYKLIKTLKEEIGIPIHLHTHDTSGNGVATILMAAQAGVDVVDAAFNSMSGLTSQPALNSVVAALQNSNRDTGIDSDKIQKISEYWRDVRPVYAGFESELVTSTAEIYKYEIPGGQYSNLKPQVESFGLGHKFEEVKDMYKTVNAMLGDIVKVTPSSKAVGDMAIFMVQNDLTPENIYEKAQGIDFPDSIVSYFEGMMGQPHGGFPEKLQKLVLKDKPAITCRPGELLPPEDFDAIKKHLREDLDLEGTDREAISYAIYPKVFEDYIKTVRKEGNFRYMGSDIFFHSLEVGETCEVKLGEGKILMVKLHEVRPVDNEGFREAIFEVNGNRRIIKIKDTDVTVNSNTSVLYANEDNPMEVGANIPGNIIRVLVKEGDVVEEKQPIAVIEAMKMETNILATAKGTVEKIYISEGQQVKAGEMVAKLK